MEKINEKELREYLQSLEKDQLINLVVKLRLLFAKVCNRLEIVEKELLEITSLNELIESIKE